MYCQNCGKEIENTTAFCPVCGTQVAQMPIMDQAPVDGNGMQAANLCPPQYTQAPVQASPKYYGAQTETITFTENPSREQSTINMHQKMGWYLKNSQEINTSTTHVYGNTYGGTGHVSSFVEKHHYVKLMFERDKSHPNYAVLKQNYDYFNMLADKIIELEASVDKRKPLFYLLCCIPSLFALIIAFSTMGGFGFAILPLALMLMVPVMLLANMIARNIRKKAIQPQVDSLYAQMQQVADDTEPYTMGLANAC